MRKKIERHPVMVRFTVYEHARLRATCPEGMPISVWARVAALAELRRMERALAPMDLARGEEDER